MSADDLAPGRQSTMSVPVAEFGQGVEQGRSGGIDDAAKLRMALSSSASSAFGALLHLTIK